MTSETITLKGMYFQLVDNQVLSTQGQPDVNLRRLTSAVNSSRNTRVVCRQSISQTPSFTQDDALLCSHSGSHDRPCFCIMALHGALNSSGGGGGARIVDRIGVVAEAPLPTLLPRRGVVLRLSMSLAAEAGMVSMLSHASISVSTRKPLASTHTIASEM